MSTPKQLSKQAKAAWNPQARAKRKATWAAKRVKPPPNAKSFKEVLDI